MGVLQRIRKRWNEQVPDPLLEDAQHSCIHFQAVNVSDQLDPDSRDDIQPHCQCKPSNSPPDLPLTVASPLTSTLQNEPLSLASMDVNPPSRRTELIAVQVSMTAVARLVVSLRLISRYMILKSPGSMSSSPHAEAQNRGKTLTRESPVPVHVPEPQNIHVSLGQFSVTLGVIQEMRRLLGVIVERVKEGL